MHLGIHYLAEFFDCDRAKIDDAALIEKVMIDAANLSAATIIRPFFHQFSPQGVSGVIVIAESHFAIHTWPEHGYTAVDLFSCSDFDCKAALNHIRITIGAKYCTMAQVRRGILTDSGEGSPAAWEDIDMKV